MHSKSGVFHSGVRTYRHVGARDRSPGSEPVPPRDGACIAARIGAGIGARTSARVGARVGAGIGAGLTARRIGIGIGIIPALGLGVGISILPTPCKPSGLWDMRV